MRSTWSAERVVTFLAIASVEGAWLTLAYLALQQLAGDGQLHLGIVHFAIAVGGGLLLARRLRAATEDGYASALIGIALLVGLAGVWLAHPVASLSGLGAAIGTTPGGPPLVGGVLGDTTHAELEEEAGDAERFLANGMIGLGAFWVIASAAGMTRDAALSAAAFAATLTFVSAALLSIGLARLAELKVEAVDRAARRRWIAMLFGVSILLLVLGIPLAAILGVPVSTALAGIAGPLGPLLLFVATVLAVPLLFLLSLLWGLLPPLGHLPLPSPGPSGSGSGAGQLHLVPSPGPGLDLMWLVWIIGIAAAALAVHMLRRLLIRPRADSTAEVRAEVREAEPIGALLPHLPRIRFRRPRPFHGTPRTAAEAYRFSVAALEGSDAERRPGETPREHARRIAATDAGQGVGRLAVDYQLVAFAGHPLTSLEERRAVARWRTIVHLRRGSRA
jgi:Domain of unknown function (DUF4129)